MPASIKPIPSRILRRLKEAEAGIVALQDMGHMVHGLTMSVDGAILLLRYHPSNERLLGEVRRVYRDSTGIWIEMEKIVGGVRVRWNKPYSQYIHAPWRVH